MNIFNNNKMPCIFLDRDGTINYEVDYLHNVADFRLLPNVGKAIRRFNQNGFITVVTTNQSGIARNILTEERLLSIHIKMMALLAQEDAYIDDVYYCPHHPDKSIPGINPKYNVECKCRKPKIGMIENAKKKYDIDLSNSYVIGDSTSDIQMGINAQVKTILVNTGYGGKDGKFDVKPDYIFEDLYEASTFIVERLNDYFSHKT